MFNAIESDLADIYSDMYKDAYGVRPRSDLAWDFESEADMRAAMDRLSTMISEQIDEDERRATEALAEFKREISDLMSEHGISEEDAYRWFVQANLAETHAECGWHVNQEAEHLLWERGALFADGNRPCVAKLTEAICAEFGIQLTDYEAEIYILKLLEE